MWATLRAARASGFLLDLANGRKQQKSRRMKKTEAEVLLTCSLPPSLPHLHVPKTIALSGGLSSDLHRASVHWALAARVPHLAPGALQW